MVSFCAGMVVYWQFPVADGEVLFPNFKLNYLDPLFSFSILLAKHYYSTCLSNNKGTYPNRNKTPNSTTPTQSPTIVFIYRFAQTTLIQETITLHNPTRSNTAIMMLSSSKHTQNTQSTQPHRLPYKRKTKATSQDLATLPKTYPEKQLLLTHFLKESSVTEPSIAKYLLTPQKTTDLEQQLKRKDKAIIELQLKNISMQADFKKANNSFSAIIKRHKQAFINSQRQLSALQRLKKGQIDPKMGFFRDLATGNFQEGEYLTQIRTALQKHQEIKIMVDSSHQYQKSYQEETHGESYQADYLDYQLQHLKQQLQRRERQLELYKTRIKLYIRETNCQLAKKNWPLLKGRYLTQELIGVGGFGEVYKAIDLETLAHVAIKLSLPDRTESPEANYKRLKYIRRQCETHRKLNHPNIANILDQFECEDRNHYLVMQYCSGPDLATYIKRRVCLPEKQARRIVKQLISVAKYLRQQKVRVIHYDLKPANILFHNGVIRVIDFGICKTIEDEKSRIALTTPGIGTYWYLPPQVFDENKQYVSQKVDIWSIGVIFFEMLYGKKPFGDGLSQMRILRDGVIVNASEVSFPAQRPLQQRVSEQAKQFIRECLAYQQKDRLGVFQAYEHHYLQEKA